eukprot:1190692-Prorocentrum_minimum.AAC.4
MQTNLLGFAENRRTVNHTESVSNVTEVTSDWLTDHFTYLRCKTSLSFPVFTGNVTATEDAQFTDQTADIFEQLRSPSTVFRVEAPAPSGSKQSVGTPSAAGKKGKKSGGKAPDQAASAGEHNRRLLVGGARPCSATCGDVSQSGLVSLHALVSQRSRADPSEVPAAPTVTYQPGSRIPYRRRGLATRASLQVAVCPPHLPPAGGQFARRHRRARPRYRAPNRDTRFGDGPGTKRTPAGSSLAAAPGRRIPGRSADCAARSTECCDGDFDFDAGGRGAAAAGGAAGAARRVGLHVDALAYAPRGQNLAAAVEQLALPALQRQLELLRCALASSSGQVRHARDRATWSATWSATCPPRPARRPS